VGSQAATPRSDPENITAKGKETLHPNRPRARAAEEIAARALFPQQNLHGMEAELDLLQ